MAKLCKFFINKIKNDNYRELNILNGCIKITNDLDKQEKIVKIFNYSFITQKIINLKKEINVANIFHFTLNYQIHALDKILKNIDSSIDDIYICKHHIGEIYIFLQLLNEYIKKNKSKNPIVIIPEKRYIELYNLFCPNINKKFLNINIFEIDRKIKIDEFIYKNHKFFIPIADRFKELRELIMVNNEAVNFYDYIKAKLGLINQPIEFKPPIINESIKEKVSKRAKKLGLNLNKFIIFSPEAVTATELSQTFWINLGHYFASKGYQIYVNTVTVADFFIKYNPNFENNWIDKIPNSIKDFATFDEIIYLAELSKGVIALVSGLVVTMALTDTPRYFIYTNQTPTVGDRMDADKMLEAYRLSCIPNCNTKNLYELNINEICEKDIFKTIVEAYK